MIEAYAFLAAFTVQILAVSVLQPIWYTRYARIKGAKYLADARCVELYPGIIRVRSERFLGLYRAVNMGVAALGLGLLVWLFSHMQRPDWNLALVSRLLSFYVMVQLTPFVLAGLTEAWVHRKALAHAPTKVKRTASLQRRGIFDVVPPVTVFIAVLAYVLFVAFVLYVRQHPYPGFTGYQSLSTVTFSYALNAGLVYWMLYRKKSAPLETRADRLRAAGVGAKFLAYASIAAIAFRTLFITLNKLDMVRWIPFMMSVYLVILMLFVSAVLRRSAENRDASSIAA